MTERGLLIAFEGGDGSGKSTQAELLSRRIGALSTRQAGGTEFGSRLRALTLEPESAHISRRAEALLYMADRAEHVENLVEPALMSGRHVVSDRWAYASLAYQGHGRGLDVDELRNISDWSMNGLWPDVVVLLDVPVGTGLGRVRSGEVVDHYEAEGAALQERVTNGYRRLAAEDPGRWRVVDGTGSIDEVADAVWSSVRVFVEGEVSQ